VGKVRYSFSGCTMTQTNNRIFDELAKLMTDAAGAAQGMRREIETLFKSQGERILREMDVVSREEFEATKAMAAKAREENEALATRLAALEVELAALRSSR
jgi:BMFP domain-containing protein YqiC